MSHKLARTLINCCAIWKVIFQVFGALMFAGTYRDHQNEAVMSKKVLVISSDVDSYEIARRMAKVTHFEFVFVDSLEKLQVQLNWSKGEFIAIHFDAATKPLELQGTADLLAAYANQIPMILYSTEELDFPECLNDLAKVSYQITEQRALDELVKSLNRLDHYAGFVTSELNVLDWVDVRDGNDEQVFQSAVKASKNDLPVLIEGGVGTPKAEMAVATHKLSSRYRHPMKIIDAEMYSPKEFHSLVFGDEISSGLLFEADHGTLFINNLNNFTHGFQDKMCEFLDQGTLYTHAKKAQVNLDVRLIIATDLDLISEVKKGAFLEALYYRLSVSPIIVNKFNTIADDMHGWIGDFVKSLKPKFSHQDIEIEHSNLGVLAKYDWPGNHAQFFQVLAWMVSQPGDGFAQQDALPHFFNPSEMSSFGTNLVPSLAPDLSDLLPVAGVAGDDKVSVENTYHMEPSQYLNLFDHHGDMRSVGDVEEELIRRAIAFYDGKMSFVAKHLGIGRSTLYRKLKEYDIDPECPLELVS
jgi:DNA-binding NtrC family response regulator